MDEQVLAIYIYTYASKIQYYISKTDIQKGHANSRGSGAPPQEIFEKYTGTKKAVIVSVGCLTLAKSLKLR